MGCRINDLRDKQVINIIDGRCLGYVDDIEIDICNGKLCAINVPVNDGKLFTFGRCKNIIIPWEQIEKIGDDIILVRIDAKFYEGSPEIVPDRSRRRRAFF